MSSRHAVLHNPYRPTRVHIRHRPTHAPHFCHRQCPSLLVRARAWHAVFRARCCPLLLTGDQERLPELRASIDLAAASEEILPSRELPRADFEDLMRKRAFKRGVLRCLKRTSLNTRPTQTHKHGTRAQRTRTLARSSSRSSHCDLNTRMRSSTFGFIYAAVSVCRGSRAKLATRRAARKKKR